MCPPGSGCGSAGLGSHFARRCPRREANTIALADMEHLDTFLSRHPPFDAIPEAELAALAAAGREVSYEAGDSVLIEDGIPAPGLWVLLTGSMDIVHEG